MSLSPRPCCHNTYPSSTSSRTLRTGNYEYVSADQGAVWGTDTNEFTTSRDTACDKMPPLFTTHLNRAEIEHLVPHRES